MTHSKIGRSAVIRKSLLTAAAFAIAGTTAAQTVSWTGPASGNWSVGGNWSGGTSPNAASFDVFVDAGNAQNTSVTVDATRTIGSLTISTGDQIGINNAISLTLSGTTLANSGTVSVNAGASSSTLRADAASFTGGGTIFLNESAGGTAFLLSSGTMTNVNNLIRGSGVIGNNSGVFVNQGTVSADVSGKILTIDTVNAAETFANSGNVNASGGGILEFSGFGGGSVGNTGTISALTGSEVRLISGAQINGGTLQSSGSGSISVAASQTAFLTGVSLAADLKVNNNATLYLQSATNANNGSINLNSAANNVTLLINGTQSTTGTGTINMNPSAGGGVFITGSGTWTNSNAILGAGTVGSNSLAIISNAPITASSASGGIVIDPVNTTNAFLNNSTLQASVGSMTLTGFGGGNFNNTSGHIIASGADVRLISSVSVTGGTLSSSGGNSIRIPPSNSAFLNSVNTSGTINVDTNATLYLNNAVTNSGTIRLNAAANNSEIQSSSGTLVLSGGGTVLMTTSAGGQPTINNVASFTNVNNTIVGMGLLGTNSCMIHNQASGLVHANISGQIMTLDPSNSGTQAFLNQGVLRASGGGILSLTGFGAGDFANTAGTIEVLTGSELRLISSAVVHGGTIAASGTGTINVPASNSVFLNGLTLSGNVVAGNNSTTNLTGTTTNTGTISLNATANPTQLSYNGSGTLSGAGTILMNQTAGGLPGITGSGTLVSNNQILGAGSIGVNSIGFVNLSTITATNSAAHLIVDPANGTSFVNNGTLQSAAGTLTLTGFGGGDFQNAAGRIIAGAGDVLLISNPSIVSGTFSGGAAGVFRIPVSNQVTLNAITSSANLTAESNATIVVLNSYTNNGSINLNAAASPANFSISGAVTLSGTGTLFMNQTAGGVPGINGSGTLTNSTAISGAGGVGQNAIAVSNTATISATNALSPLILDPANGTSITNTGTLQSAAGQLHLTGFGGGDFQNTGGRIIAGAGEVQMYTGASVTGGTLSGGVFRVLASQSISLAGLHFSGNLNVETNATANVSGTIVNTGSINLNAAANNVSLSAPGGGTISGAGTIFMNRTAGGISVITSAGFLRIDNSIAGAGAIGANQGSYLLTGPITASIAGSPITLDPANGGSLTSNSLLRVNTGASAIATGFGGGTINGTGSVDVQAGGTFLVDSGASFTQNLITSNGSFIVQTSSNASVSAVQGAGTVIVSNSSLLTTRPNGTQASTSKAVSLTVQTSSKLDLNDNAMVVDYTGASPLSTIRSHIISGFNGGSWNGNGIIATPGATDKTKALGYGEASATPFTTTFRGQSFVGGDAVLMMYTLKGDSNLDRTVSSLDFNQLSYGIINGTALWTQGDFDYNGKVNTIDFNWLAGNFGQTLPAAGDLPEAALSLGSVVPEPGSISLLALGGLTLRRKHHRGR